MAKTFVITSGKGGVGKSNIAVNVAVELARRQLRTCLFDADLGLANVNLLFGIHPERTVDDLLFRDVPLEQIMIRTEHGVDVLPGSSGVEQLANLDRDRLGDLLSRFQSLDEYDYLLIDTGSGISRNVISFCLAAEETILVLTPENTSLADAYATLKVLSLNGYMGTVRVVVNKCASIPQAKKTYRHFHSVAEKYLKVVLQPGGVVLQDNQLSRAVSLQFPAVALAPESVYSQCIRALVANLLRSRESDSGEDDAAGEDFWARFARVVDGDLLLPGGDSRPTAASPVPQNNITTVSPAEKRQRAAATTPGNSSPYPNVGLWSQDGLPGPVSLYGYILEEESRGGLVSEQIERLVAHDPGLLGRLLATVGQRQRGAGRKRTGIAALIEELGEDSVRRFMVGTATHTLLGWSNAGDLLAVNRLWLHSLRCGLMARSLAELVNYPAPEEVYIGGLLHDLGRLLLQNRFPTLYRHYQPHEHPEEMLEAERQRVGRTHMELGAELLAEWGVNSFIVDGARFHGEPDERIATALDMTRLICVGHRLSIPVEEQVAEGVDSARELLHISPAQVFICMQKVSEEVNRIGALYGIEQHQNEETAHSVLDRFRRRAVELTTLQGVLPPPAAGGGKRAEVRSICRGLQLLFGLNRAICLFPDPQSGKLRATGYGDGYGQDFVDNIVFSLNSKGSSIVEAYRSKGVCVLSGEDLSVLADRQLLGLMRSELLLCLPLQVGGVRSGLVICGIGAVEREHFTPMFSTLELFAARAAARLSHV